jgi:hypothetical protein
MGRVGGRQSRAVARSVPMGRAVGPDAGARPGGLIGGLGAPIFWEHRWNGVRALIWEPFALGSLPLMGKMLKSFVFGFRDA